MLTRKGRLIGLVVFAALFIEGLGIAAIIVGVNAQPDPTFHDGAVALCREADVPKTPPQEARVQIAQALPNMGTPEQIIVAPACSQNPRTDRGTPGHFQTKITVYLVLSSKQISQLSLVQSASTNEDLNPLGVASNYLTHLISDEQREEIERGTLPREVQYIITQSSSTNKLPVASATKLVDGYNRMTLPRDLVSGKYYLRSPKPAVRTSEAGVGRAALASVKD